MRSAGTDSGFTVLSGLSVYQELGEADGLLLSLHANDNDGLNDLHLVPLGSQASIDWDRFRRILKDLGYLEPFMLEVYGGEASDKVVEAAGRLCERLPGLQL